MKCSRLRTDGGALRGRGGGASGAGLGEAARPVGRQSSCQGMGGTSGRPLAPSPQSGAHPGERVRRIAAARPGEPAAPCGGGGGESGPLPGLSRRELRSIDMYAWLVSCQPQFSDTRGTRGAARGRHLPLRPEAHVARLLADGQSVRRQLAAPAAGDEAVAEGGPAARPRARLARVRRTVSRAACGRRALRRWRSACRLHRETGAAECPAAPGAAGAPRARAPARAPSPFVMLPGFRVRSNVPLRTVDRSDGAASRARAAARPPLVGS